MVLRRAGIFVALVLAQTLEIGSTSISHVANHTWENGRVGYFAVPRERVAAKLAELQQDSCHEGLLTLPNCPVLQDLINPDQHIVAVAYGSIISTSFEDSLPSEAKSKYETRADTVQFYIPMLTGADPYADPIYKLSLGSFVATDKPFLQPNVVIPTEQVDGIDASSNGLVITDGSERFEVVWSNLGACEKPDDVVVQDIDKYIDELTLSFGENPGYPFCDEPGSDQFIFCGDPSVISCACQVWIHGNVRKGREDFFSVQYSTPKFAELSLLTDAGPQDAVIAEFNEGFFGIGVVPSCIVSQD